MDYAYVQVCVKLLRIRFEPLTCCRESYILCVMVNLEVFIFIGIKIKLVPNFDARANSGLLPAV